MEIRKVLIANRGEIAVRVIRTCRELGIRTIAVYSDVDRYSLHVKLADEAHYIGPPEPSKSYLNIDAIIKLAKKLGVDAIHPGYGFLAENPEFAKKCIEEGIVFIGPPPRIHECLGDKLRARKLATEIGVPVPPGSFKPLTPDEAVEMAEKIGYPVIVKPAGGGGGIGMQVARDEKELKRAVTYASELSRKYFGREEVYIEKYFTNAKHIEVQIAGDGRGNIIHYFERECSVQRRYQKVIEETPSPILTEERGQRLFNYAIKIARALNYENLGTVEFVYDLDSDEFYFLEVNTRIQVEHPITEEVTGIDLVKDQIYIAWCRELPHSQNEISRRGHAIEFRIYGEDPLTYIPQTGRVEYLELPGGPGVRIDLGVTVGQQVTQHYDTLLMKLIVWGRTRAEAIARGTRALKELKILGIKVNTPLHRAVLKTRDFIEGRYTTTLLSRNDVRELVMNEIELWNNELKTKTPTYKSKSTQIVITDRWVLTKYLVELLT
ncbi:MAG: acetyl-CoA carboxylase biotin carboxylase subunit [Thermoprotei archaeon]|nr:MAG: acetyl-CoA carboxylase biotin carboxylase subunit [Thermoprotei archaeon]